MGLIKVVGESMSPTLNDGDYLLTKKPRSLRPGFIYVVQHERLGRIVKRLDSLSETHARFRGDNPQSTSAERIGEVPLAQIKRQVWAVITPKGARRL